VQPVFPWKCNNITYYECVFVALGIQHAMRLRHIVICGLSRSSVLFYIISQTARLSKHTVEHKVLVLICSTTFFWNISSFSEELSEIWSKLCIDLHAKCRFSCHILMELIFSTDFGKKLKYQILWKPVRWEPRCSMRTDRRTHMMMLIVAFRNFAKVAQNGRTKIKKYL
jgi:hypothetical protein